MYAPGIRLQIRLTVGQTSGQVDICSGFGFVRYIPPPLSPTKISAKILKLRLSLKDFYTKDFLPARVTI